MTDSPLTPPNAQTDAQGYVAVRYRQPGQVLLQNMPSGAEYVAVTRANICMAWVKPEDLPAVLLKRDYCCGGHANQAFHLANEADVRRWTNGGGE